MATWIFSKLPGLQYYFPENFRCNLKFYEGENFFLESENFRFPFYVKNSLIREWNAKKITSENRRDFIR